LSSTPSEQLEKLVRQIDELRKLHHDSPQLYKWRDEVHNFLRKQFGPISSQIRQFDSIAFSPTTFGLGMSESYFTQKYQKGLDTAETFLRSMVDQITSTSPVPPQVSSNPQGLTQTPVQPQQQEKLFVRVCPYGHEGVELLDVYSIASEKAAASPPSQAGEGLPAQRQQKQLAKGYRCVTCNIVFYVLQRI
jgi:hypothetical protein